MLLQTSPGFHSPSIGTGVRTEVIAQAMVVAAQGMKNAAPDGLVELPAGDGGKTNEFDAEDVAADPADFSQVDGKGRRLIGQENIQPHITAGVHRPIAGNGAAGCGQVYQGAFAHKRGAAEDHGKGDGKTIGGPCLLLASHACPGSMGPA